MRRPTGRHWAPGLLLAHVWRWRRRPPAWAWSWLLMWVRLLVMPHLLLLLHCLGGMWRAVHLLLLHLLLLPHAT